MTWWAWLIIAGVVALATALVVYISMRGRYATKAAKAEVDKLKASIAQQLKETDRLTIEQAKKKEKELVEKLKSVNAWYNNVKQQIEEERQNEFETLVGDPDALDTKLDSLLGTDSNKS